MLFRVTTREVVCEIVISTERRSNLAPSARLKSIIELEKFNSLTKLLRVTAYVVHFKNKLSMILRSKKKKEEDALG